jgi:hypothetical protein
MKRRHFLGAGLALAAASALRVPPADGVPIKRMRPGMPGWPADADWAALNQATNGRLSPVNLPKLDAPDARKLLANPFYIADEPGLTQSSGWQNAWRSSPSAYVVAAETDVAAAVRFASAHNLRLVVKGRGPVTSGRRMHRIRCWSGRGRWTPSACTTLSPLRGLALPQFLPSPLAPVACGCTFIRR